MALWTLPLRPVLRVIKRRHVVASVTNAPIGHRFPFISPITIIIFILIFLLVGDSHILSSTGEYTNDVNNDRGLFPPTFNLASTANITSNATCGENGEETFCKLVEHVREPQCGVCDSRSSNVSRRHPISNAIDGTNEWWQSPSLQNGRQFEWVTITLDLQQVYQVAYVIVKAANSPRPGNWILERSLDGLTFHPWQYYAINEAECIEAYGIHPTVGIPRYRSDDEVICTAYYSRLEPLENGEIHTSLVKGRPGVSGPTDRLQEFTAARFVRLRLQKLRSLHADLMTVTTRDWEKGHKTVTRRLFYSIKDISIGGQCMCFGHAQDCRSDPLIKRLKCHCVHNTCGDSCEKCCPLYNQKPWRLGTSTEAGVCEKCQCYGHADECRYDKEVAVKRESVNIEGKYKGGGVCIGCRDFTMGINCEQCVNGYYRPDGVQPDSSQPCVKCDCTGLGTVGHCVKDSSRIKEGKKAGDCICREGFAGTQCDRCDVGYRNYPICDLCPCNFAGTVNTECEGECICKAHVDGVRCDRCKPGYFHLDDANPKGCRKCFCSGATSRCVSADMGIEVLTSRGGWQISDVLGQKVIRPTAEGSSWTVASDDMTGHEAYFWLAPEEFTGNKLNAYGGEISYNLSWVKARGDSAGWLTSGPAIVLDGGGMMIAYWSDVAHKTSDVAVGVTLTESGWTHFSPDHVTHPKKIKRKELRHVSRKNFMEVLVMLDRVLIQAKYHTDQIVGKLNSVSIEMGSENAATVRRLKNIERCHCPTGYAGLSCENCERGYRRVNNSAYGGKCQKCDCNGHVDSCDPYTGTCHECLHHTAGENCQVCEVGYYGLATRGTVDDCKKCACPLEDSRNQWSETCTAVVVNKLSVNYTCDSCAVGYSGAKCEICAKGFFGNPMIPGNFCQPCYCHGHSNATINCDNLTGLCLDCLGNREGWNCTSCKDGFWGDPLAAPCQECKCDPFGSVDPTKCDKKTGECYCHALYVGQRCDRCIDNYGNIEAGCHSCDCNETGSVSLTCDPVSGQCQCKIGTFGTKCDACLDGYYGFADTGCKWCNCNVNGSLSSTCHSESGQCSCTADVDGLHCDRCKDGFWNMITGRGCEQCQCNSTGSLSSPCNQTTGQCLCREGVGGVDCSKCLPGFYGFSNNGCQKCADCDKAGYLCDPWSGECVCPPLTTGPSCQQCLPNSWGYDPLLGCRTCNCSLDGSLMSQCDLLNGECMCLEGYEGRQCDRCRFGYFDFLKCKRCKCHLEGTDPTKCRLDGHCECNEEGQCPCKTNVEGKKCRRCKSGTFGRTPIQMEGCTPCFCFGKSNRCRQGDLVWTRLAHLDSRKANVDGNATSVKIVLGLQAIPGTEGDIEVLSPVHIDAPLYWKLPDSLQGDLVASYNGRMIFRVGSSGGQRFPSSVLNTYPLVLLQGNSRLVLEYYADVIAPDGWYDVHLHESRWRFKNNPDVAVDRPTMMVALQRVQNILIRATDRSDFTSAWLTNVSVDILTAPEKRFSPSVAIGIEICQCPPRYNGTSCQDPANGYYRFKKNDSLDSKDILDLVGIALPCPCNDRSKDCDKETGFCKNCQLNTSGNHCERCANGFYGDPSLGLCQPCACPTVNNSFSDLCAIIGSTLTCTNCREGHYGYQCERCMHGYYGDPLSPGGKCLPCNCDVRGSMGNVCDQETGQCICLDGLTGRDCSVCPHRHVLTEYGCQSCQDECTGLLLDDLDDIFMTTISANISGINPAPWGKLIAYENQIDHLKEQLSLYKRLLLEGEKLTKDFEYVFNLPERADAQLLKIYQLQSKSSATCSAAEDFLWNAQEFLKLSSALQQLIAETVRRLHEYAAGVSKESGQLSSAIKEAESEWSQIMEVKFDSQNQEAHKELRKAQLLLKKVMKLIFEPSRLNDLDKKLKMLTERLNEAQNLIPENIHLIWMQLENIQMRFNHSKELFQRANETTHESMSILDVARNLNKQARMNLLLFNNSKIQEKLSDLEKLTTSLDSHIKFLAHKLPNAHNLTKLANISANKLAEEAKYLDKLFNSIRNESLMAMKASNAYSDVTNLINKARDVAVMANLAINNLIDPKSGGLPNPSIIAGVSSNSIELRMMASNLDTEKLYEMQTRTRAQAYATAATINSTRSRFLDLKMEMTNISFIPDILRINDKSARATRIADKVKVRLVPILGNLTGRVEQARKLSLASNETIWNITDKVNKTMANISRFTDSGGWKRRDGNKTELKDRLSLMRDNITAYRQSFGNWLIGLSGDGECSRELRHELDSVSVSNTISFHYSITTNHKNSLIFYLGNPDMNEYLAVEMVDRTMRLVWDAGGGPTVVEYHLTKIETLEDTTKPSNLFKIEANRTGNRGFIRVKDERNESWPTTNETKSKSDSQVISFGSKTRLLIGQLPSGIKTSPLVSRQFYGCLSNLKLNDQSIGLWDFKTSSQKCIGCKIEPIPSDQSGFRGNGYLIITISKTKRAKDQEIIQLSFQTFDENSLLLFTSDEIEDGFLALYLYGGRVFLTIRLNKSPNIIVLHTNKKYNNNRLIKVQATLRKQFGSLQVKEEGQLDGDEKIFQEDATAGEQSGNKNLNYQRYYIGGVPRSTNLTKWSNTGVNFSPFYGCINSYSMESMRGWSKKKFGVTSECPPLPSNRLLFEEDGYLELKGKPLKAESNISFVIKPAKSLSQTKKVNSMLLLSTLIVDSPSSYVKEDFFSLVFENGALILNCSECSMKASSTGQFKANETQHIFIKRSKRTLELRVNDELVQSLTVKNLATIESQRLFLGGVSADIRDTAISRGQISVSKSFLGVISDVTFDYEPAQFNDYVNRFNVTQGYNMPLQKMKKKVVKRCADKPQIGLESKAFKFGDSNNSFISLTLNKSKIDNMSFDFRTHYPDGLLMILSGENRKQSGTAEKQRRQKKRPKKNISVVHLIIYLEKGSIIVKSNASRFSINGSFHDGQWHNVRLEKLDRKMMEVKIDSQMIKITPNLTKLRSVGFGNLVKSPRNLNIPSFKGCIRNYKVNGVDYDFSGAKRVSIGICFSNVEAGSWFGGDAYAVYDAMFNVGVQIEMKLQFRTTETSGVLITISDLRGLTGLQLGLLNGNVTMRAILDSGEVLDHSVGFGELKYYVCDDRWHNVSATFYTDGFMKIEVDKEFEKTLKINLNKSGQLGSGSLYIGGLPGKHVKQIQRELVPNGTFSQPGFIRDNFKGCIRKVAIQDRIKDWIDMSDLHNVLINSCYLQQISTLEV